MANTTHYAWAKPTVDADEDTWGDILNTALDDIDADLHALATGAAYEPLGKTTTRNVTGTSDTLVLTDIGKTINYENAGAITATIPPNSSVAFPTDTIIPWETQGAGQVTFTPGSGVTIRSLGSATKSAGQYASGYLKKIDTNEWLLAGAITT